MDWLDRGSGRDKERAWMLNRHGFLPFLAEAFQQTGDDAYKHTLNDLWKDWILSNDYPGRLNFSPPWRALEVARRILNAWVHLFHGYAILEPETRLLVLASVLDHGDTLRHHASFWGGNHLITEKLALLTLAIAWPEFKPSEEWEAYAVDRVSHQLLAQTYPDGSYMELSNHYQRVVLVNAQYFLRLLATIDPDFRNRPVFQRIEKMWDFFTRVMRPDGFGPLNNASDLDYNAGFVREVWSAFDRPDWLYIASNGTEGQPPSYPSSRLFPWAGQVILRNTWERQAHWIYFDAGPYGTAHQHIDRLHLSASIDGRPILVDGGRYTYLPGEWKAYFSGPGSHNLMILDGQPSEQAPRKVHQPLPVVFQQEETWAFTAAQSRFTGTEPILQLPTLRQSVPWTRAVLLDFRGMVVIVDHLLTFRSHQLTGQWHFHPDLEEAEIRRHFKLASPWEGGSSVLRKGTGQPGEGGHFSPKYNQLIPSTRWSFAGPINRPTTLVWMLQSPDIPEITVEIMSTPGSPILEFKLISRGQELAKARIRLHPEPRLLEYTPF